MYSYIVYMLHWIVYNRAKKRCKMYIENIETEEKCWVKNCTWLKVKVFLSFRNTSTQNQETVFNV